MAAFGFLEWFFLGLLALLVALTGAFALYVVASLFRNTGFSRRR